MESGSIRSYKKNKGYESIPRELLQNFSLSMEAIGLLCHLQSYPENWKLYKTELYNRFQRNKRTSIQRIWKELVDNNYMIEFKRREGKKYVYQYVYSIEPFDKQDIEQIKEEMRNDGFFWTVDFEQSKMNCSKSTANKLTIKEINYKKKGESSFSSLSPRDDDDKSYKKKETSDGTFQNMEKLDFLEKAELLRMYLANKLHLAPLSQSMLRAGISLEDTLEIIQFLAKLPKIDQQISDLINTQIKANEHEAKTNGLSNYKAYFLTGLKMKLKNANIDIPEVSIAEIDSDKQLPKVTLHNWLDSGK